jgi:hypothetical protein
MGVRGQACATAARSPGTQRSRISAGTLRRVLRARRRRARSPVSAHSGPTRACADAGGSGHNCQIGRLARSALAGRDRGERFPGEPEDADAHLPDGETLAPQKQRSEAARTPAPRRRVSRRGAAHSTAPDGRPVAAAALAPARARPGRADEAAGVARARLAEDKRAAICVTPATSSSAACAPPGAAKNGPDRSVLDVAAAARVRHNGRRAA